MTDQELEEIFKLMQAPASPPPQIEFRLYHDEQGRVLTYTSEKLSGNYIVITKEQYLEARGDAVVKDGELHYTHVASHLFKLTRNSTQGVMTSKYDINILCDTGDTNFWNYTSYEIR